MADDSKAPTWLTEVTINDQPAPAASASDSAPPPTANPQPAPLPLRNYSTLPVYPAPPPAYAPNSSVPRFIRLLAALLFLGGSLSAAAAWLFKAIIYPRLVLALKARTRLFTVHEVAYSKFLDALEGFTKSKGCVILGGTAAIEFRRKLKADGEDAERTSREGDDLEGEEKENEKEREEEKVLKSQPDDQLDEKEQDQSSPVSPILVLPPPPQVLEPIQQSLASLRTALSTTTTSSAARPHSNPSNLVQPPAMLMRSLVSFNEYLDSESHAVALVHAHRGYGLSSVSGGAALTGEKRALQETTQALKAEIRSLKGALLNRRNFARPAIDVGQVTTAA
ncbi:hypothetical protein JCM21900_004011 [Sporobolomyces salmonicolor]